MWFLSYYYEKNCIYCISGILFNRLFLSEVEHICFRNVLVLGLPILTSFPVCEPRVAGIMERFLNSMTSINPVQKSLSQPCR